MKTISLENNFIYLFFALLLFLFSSALQCEFSQYVQNGIYQAIVVLVFLIGVHSLKSNKSWLWAVYVMAFVSAVLFLSKYFFYNTILFEYIHLLIFLSFFVGSFALSYKQIVMSKAVNQNMIIGSLVLYMLLGLVWSILYLLLLTGSADAFNGIEGGNWRENLSQVIYFSFVTLTTLGYGDISPNTALAKFFVYIEAIAGVFYIAVIVSSLVSARLTKKD